jgi:hypothetical protein
VSESVLLKPDKPDKPEKSEKEKLDPSEKALRQRGLLDPSDRYRALINGVEAAQDLIELADKKARFALVIMSLLNAVAVLLVVRGGDALIPRTGPIGIVVGIELIAYVIATVYYISQAIAALRPRGVKSGAMPSLPNDVEPGASMRVLFYGDVVARDRAAYRELWERLRMDNLTAELADQLYTLSWINQQKFSALTRLYFGLTVLTVLLAALIGTIGLGRIWG